MKLTVKANAKINLLLDITGIKENGYHSLFTIMQSISLGDTVTVERLEGEDISISCTVPGVPTDSRNIVYKCAVKFFEYAGITQNKGIHIHIDKVTPFCAGMGGGSADAAGVIVGLDKIYETNLTRQQMCEIGAKAGSDVPFMIMGGTKRVQGVGEIIKPCPPMPRCHLVICMPDKGVSTPAAFANYDTLGEKTLVETDKLVAAMEENDIYGVAKYMANDLEKAAASEYTQPIKEELIQQGAIGSVMTGSGAAVFGVFDDEDKAKAAVEYFRDRVRSVFIAKPVGFGATIAKDRPRIR